MKLPLPLQALDDRLAIVGRSGYGKTNAAKVMAEQLLATHTRVCILDPTDAWWGLRLQPDGRTPAFPVAIFGGAHGDLALTEHAGDAVGTAIATSSQSTIVSMADFMGENARRRFASAFLVALYNHNREPLHLIVDEADTLAPQKPIAPLDAEVLSRMQQIVRRGRIRGFVPWLITQRPAVLNKDVLSQADGLIAFNLTASQDRDAIGAWIEGQADKADQKAILAQLPKLERGSAMVWAPGRGILEQAAFPLSATFDSGRTPKRGEARPSATLQAIDVEGLRGKLAVAETEAKANDPAALKAEIAKLRAELAKKVPAEVPDHIIRDAEARGWREGRTAGAAEVRRMYGERIQALTAALDAASRDLLAPMPALEPTTFQRVDVPHTPRAGSPPPAAPKAERSAPPPQGRASGGEQLGKGDRLVLTVLAQYHPTRVSASKAAAIAGYSVRSSTWRNILSRLRQAGHIEQGPEPYAITPAGFATLGDWQPLPTGAALLEHWMARVGKGDRETLRILATLRGECQSSDLAERAGYSASSSTWRNILSRLRILGLIEGSRNIKLHEDLR